MKNNIEKIEKLKKSYTDEELDRPVTIEYTDGEEINLPTLRDMLNRQIELEEIADEFISVNFPKTENL